MAPTDNSEEKLAAAIVEMVRDRKQVRAEDVIRAMKEKRGADEFETREAIWKLWHKNELELTSDRFLQLPES